MGSGQGKFDKSIMKKLEAKTSLNRYEIYHAFRQFHQIYREYQQTADEVVPNMVGLDGYINTDVQAPVDMIAERLPALQVNPFRTHICAVFSAEDKSMMSFIDFLDMVSVFSPKTDLKCKSRHAFLIFDVDRDGIINRKDINALLDMMTDGSIKDDHKLKDYIIDGVFAEVNKEPSCDGLSVEDFQYALSRSPDFSSTFSFKL